MLVKQLVIVICIVFSSNFSGFSENKDIQFSANQFYSSSLIVTQTVQEQEMQEKQPENNRPAIIEKQEKSSSDEKNSLITPYQKKSEQASISQDERKTKIKKLPRKNRKKLKRRSSKQLLAAYNKAREKTEKESLEALEGIRLVGYKIKYKPRALFTKNYWIDRLFPDLVWHRAYKSGDPDEYLEDFHSTYRTIEPPTKADIELKKKIIRKRERRKKRKMKQEIYRLRYGYNQDVSDIRPETLRNTHEIQLHPYLFKDYYRFSWKNVIKYGPTLQEVENAFIILAFIRFCIYTIRYGIKTAFVICSIGLVSSLIMMSMLYDAVLVPYHRIYLCPSFFRFLFEEYLNLMKLSDYEYFNDIVIASIYKKKSWTTTLFNWVHSQHLIYNLKQVIPNWLSDAYYNSPLSAYFHKAKMNFEEYYYSTLRPLIKEYRKSLPPITPMVVYYLILRMGKSIVPYHIQWYGMFYFQYIYFGTYIWVWFDNSLELLHGTLIPQLRVPEIELMNLLHSTVIGILVYLIMLAMLHAVFSQYFYVPIWVPNIEAHIGKRPKDDIYSGGYTSWQDELQLWKPSRADFKLWFGLLGKGPNDRKRKKKRRRNKKKPK